MLIRNLSAARPFSTDIVNSQGAMIRVLVPPLTTAEILDVDPFYLNQDKILRNSVFVQGSLAVTFLPEPDDLVSLGGGAGQGTSFEADCLASDIVGDIVIITGDEIAGRFQVTRMDPRDVTEGPAVGLLESKTSSTECVIKAEGLLLGIHTGLTPQKALFVGLDGRVTSTPASITALPAGKVFVQMIGVALSSTDVLVTLEKPAVKIA